MTYSCVFWDTLTEEEKQVIIGKIPYIKPSESSYIPVYWGYSPEEKSLSDRTGEED